MKKLFFSLALILATSLFGPESPTFGQSAQDAGKWNAVNKFDVWKLRTNFALNDTFKVAAGDTIYSEVFLTWPWMTLNAVAKHTSGVSGDSVNVRIDLFQWYEYVNASTDSANFCFVKTLTVSGNDSSKVNQASIDSEGGWASNITADPIHVQKHSRLRIIGLTRNRIRVGEYLFLKMTGWREL